MIFSRCLVNNTKTTWKARLHGPRREYPRRLVFFLFSHCTHLTAAYQGELSKTLELVDEASRRSSEPDRVVACEVWGDGVVALLSTGKVKAVSGIHSAEPR